MRACVFVPVAVYVFCVWCGGRTVARRCYVHAFARLGRE